MNPKNSSQVCSTLAGLFWKYIDKSGSKQVRKKHRESRKLKNKESGGRKLSKHTNKRFM